ncbi:MAG: thioredoxin-disulfide reductase [PVC group bacterium]|nr:thioredoxin-disulfide reductase [PVC group bacterium]
MFDMVIIGAGPAGLTACLYALRSRLDVLMVDKMQIGGGLGYIQNLENYPGFPDGISGLKLADDILAQLRSYEFKFLPINVSQISGADKSWQLEASGEKIITKSTIVAIGAEPKKLGVPGEETFIGKGVSYCAVCDALFFREKNVVVVGGGNAALEEAMYLTKFASSVTIVHRRDKFRADEVLQERVRDNSKIKFEMNAVCEEVVGAQTVNAVNIKYKDGTQKQIVCDGVFIFIGTSPKTGFLPDVVKKDPDGYILTDENMKTSAEGIYACGDCRVTSLRQVVTACGEGAVAAYSAQKYLDGSNL